MTYGGLISAVALIFMLIPVFLLVMLVLDGFLEGKKLRSASEAKD